MPRFTVGGPTVLADVRLPGTDSEVPRIIYERFIRPIIDTGFGIAPPAPSQSPSSGMDVGTAIAARSPVGLFKQLFFHGSSLNSGAELQIGEGPDGKPRVGYVVVDDGTGGKRFVYVLPMWKQDP